jgi:hypothetical protein
VVVVVVVVVSVNRVPHHAAGEDMRPAALDNK